MSHYFCCFTIYSPVSFHPTSVTCGMAFQILKAPSTIILAGSSGAGKTYWVRDFLLNLKHFSSVRKFHKILWCTDDVSSIPQEIRHMVIPHKGIPDFKNKGKKPMLIIIDDLMSDGGYSDNVQRCFTKYSHHRNISCILITQNIFYKAKNARDLSINAKIIVIFKTPRDVTQFNRLASQMRPGNSRTLNQAYMEATKKPFSHFIIDYNQTTDDSHRFKSNIFEHPGGFCTVFTDLPATYDEEGGG